MRQRVIASIEPLETPDLAPMAPSNRKLERQRGHWSLLAWAFFVDQVMHAKSLLAQGAHAGEDYDGVAAHSADDSAPQFDEPASAAPQIAASAEQSLGDEAASHSGNHAARPLLLDNASQAGTTWTLKSASNEARPDSSGGDGGGGGDAGAADLILSSGSLEDDARDQISGVGSSQILSPDHIESRLDGELSKSSGLGANFSLASDADVHTLTLNVQADLASDLGVDHFASDLVLPLEVTAAVNPGGAAELHAQIGALFSVETTGPSAYLLDSTLRDITGLQMPADPGSLTAQILDMGSHIGSPGNTLPLANIVSDVANISGLKQAGDISLGGTISFPSQKLPEPDALFNGTHYTEYNQILQSQPAEVGHIAGAVKSDTAGIDTPSSHVEPTPDKHVDASAAPAPSDHVLDNPILHSAIAIGHLNSH
jgi:hypothetical protein